MKIGLDLDHTITESPMLFKIIMAGCKQYNVEVHIITYRDNTKKEVKEELAELGITSDLYTDIHLPGPQDLDAPDWKSELVDELGVDVMFEDTPEVLAKMSPTVKRLWIADPEVFDLNAAIMGMKSETRMKTIN